MQFCSTKHFKMIKHIRINILFIALILNCTLFAQEIFTIYKSADSSNPIQLTKDYFIFQADTTQLNENSFFIDGQLPSKEIRELPYIFNSINEACKHLSNGTENEAMVLHIAPYVYWIDNPDDTTIRYNKDGSTPFGLEIECEWLKFHGLTQNAKNVVLACNRGQTIGAKGNFTLFKILGDGISSENVTFGNYCNVDLEYPLKPELSRKKRASAIVQAQLIICNGDKIVAKNTRFISRLNLCPFVGGKRVFFDSCHFECTDDALCGSAVYLNSTFDFYSSKPFYHTTGTGAVFLNCDITSFTSGKQYFTKANGQLAVIDTRIYSKSITYVGWNNNPKPETRNYEYNVSLNDTPLLIENLYANRTVVMDEENILNAYKFVYNNQYYYNIYNLLQGDDNWDPAHQKTMIEKAQAENNISYTNLPVQLKISKTQVTIETGKDSLKLDVSAYRFGNYSSPVDSVTWVIPDEYKDFIRILPSGHNNSCIVIPTNNTNDTKPVTITTKTTNGLEAASMLYIAPKMVAPPEFVSKPKINISSPGTLSVEYQLSSNFEDQSLIRWYRCNDTLGSNAIEVATSRNNIPFKNFILTNNDLGYYIMASVSPKHSRCLEGEPQKAIYPKIITKQMIDVESNELRTDFKNIPVSNQYVIQPGFWTFDYFRSKDTLLSTKNRKRPSDAWYYGQGQNGAEGYEGLIPSGRSASMFFTPLDEDYNTMTVSFKVAPFKSAGQGFSVAPLYMDFLIDFNAKTSTGYGIRFVRTTKYGNAVDCFLVKYAKGTTEQIGDAVTTNCFRSICTINLTIDKETISVTASSSNKVNKEQTDILNEIKISKKIEPAGNFGLGINFNGGAPVLIKEISAAWE